MEESDLHSCRAPSVPTPNGRGSKAFVRTGVSDKAERAIEPPSSICKYAIDQSSPALKGALMAEDSIHELRHPIQCLLWEHPERAKVKFSEIFDQVEEYEDSSHLNRALYKCKECGQLYFFEWYEWVDWDEGNDKSYSTLIPVQTPQEIEALKETSTFDLMTYYPRLHLDGQPSWNGKP